jgi:hypothetical protein
MWRYLACCNGRGTTASYVRAAHRIDAPQRESTAIHQYNPSLAADEKGVALSARFARMGVRSRTDRAANSAQAALSFHRPP